MRRFVENIAAIVAAALVTIVAAPTAHPQAVRTFVSGHGADTGTCGVGAPCRTFAYAVTQTAAAGEIVVLDSAGYGIVTINQSVTITNPGGVEAAITAPSGGTAVTINVAAQSAITLRGLTLAGGGVGANGIDVISTIPGVSATSSLNIVDCVVKDFTSAGIVVQPTGSGVGTTGINILIADSLILDNSATGIKFASHNVGLFPAILRTSVSNSGVGIDYDGSAGGVTALLANSTVANSLSSAITLSGGLASLEMKASTAVLTNGGTVADVTSSSTLFLFDHNTISQLVNNGSGISDGSNNVSVVGTALVRTNPQ